MKDHMDKVTFLIKTFERPKELDRLIKSIKRFFLLPVYRALSFSTIGIS